MSNYYNRQWRLPNNENKDKQSNYSMDFDGSQKITLNSSIQLTTNKSISVWCYVEPTVNQNTLLGGDAFPIYYFWLDNPNSKIYIRDSSNITQLSTGTLSEGWTHFCITGDGTTATLYVNGVSTSTGTDRQLDIRAIGGYVTGSTYFFNGKSDGVAIFDYALSSSQVTTLYGSSSTGIGNPMSLSPKPVAYYPLGDQDSFNGSNYLVPNSSLKDYVFDFDNDNILINTLNLGTQSTESFWVKRTTSSSALWLGRLGPSGSNQGGYPLYLTSTTIFTRITTAGGSKTITFSTPNDTWMHVCRVRNGNNVSVYVSYNGTFNQNSGSNNFAAFTGLENEDTIISEFTGGSDNVYEASNWQFFNTALSLSDVETLYNNGSPLTSMSGFTSLQGWWKLDASATYNSSTTTWTIPDSSSNSNDGTSSGMTQANLVQSDLSFKSGYSPYALDFDGTSNYINISDSTDLKPQNITVSFWVNAGTQSVNYKYFLEKGNNSYAIYTANTTTDLKFFIYDGSNYYLSNALSNAFDGNWHHIAFTYDGSQIIGYKDGVANTPVSASGTILYDTDPLRICSRAPSAGNYPSAKISNVSIWNVGLTSAQVSEIYNEGVPSNLNNHSAYSNLVSWWQLGSNSSFSTNWTVLDEKGSNDGTSVNMTEDDIVDGVNTYGNGLSSGFGGDEVIGDAPYSSSNSLSVNMDVDDRVSDTPT